MTISHGHIHYLLFAAPKTISLSKECTRLSLLKDMRCNQDSHVVAPVQHMADQSLVKHVIPHR